MDIGSAVGRAAGVTDAQLRALPEYGKSSRFSDLERLVLDYAVAMTSTPVDVSETLFAELRRHFNDEQMIELTATIAWENYRARFDHALGIEAQGFSEGASSVPPAKPRRR
jgi:alkylhydroperoxidase family enzyme